MKLYVFPPSPNARKVLMTAIHLGLPYEMQMVDLGKGDQRKPEYLKLNPNGVMPTLVDGDFVLWESDAIMQYLCSKKPGVLLPLDERARADVMRWQCWELAHWSPACGTLLFENLVKGLLGIGAPDPARIKDGQERFARWAAVLDGHLAGRQWLAGNGLTLADLSVASMLSYPQVCGMPLEKYPNIQAWLGRVSGLDCWKKTAPPPG